MNDMTPEEAWQYFYSNFNTIIDRSVPMPSLVANKVKYKTIYIKKEAIRLRKKKLEFWTQYCVTLDPISYAHFTQE